MSRPEPPPKGETKSFGPFIADTCDYAYSYYPTVTGGDRVLILSDDPSPRVIIWDAQLAEEVELVRAHYVKDHRPFWLGAFDHLSKRWEFPREAVEWLLERNAI